MSSKKELEKVTAPLPDTKPLVSEINKCGGQESEDGYESDTLDVDSDVPSCPLHKTKALDMFCEVCQSMACRECLIGAHFGHYQRVVKASSVFERYKANASEWVKSYTEHQMSTMDKVKKDLEARSETLKMKQAEIIYRIRECERHMSIAISRRFNQMVKEVVSAINDEHAKLNSAIMVFDRRACEISEIDNAMRRILQQNSLPCLLKHCSFMRENIARASELWPQTLNDMKEMHVTLSCANPDAINKEMRDQINKLVNLEIFREAKLAGQPMQILKRRLARDQ